MAASDLVIRFNGEVFSLPTGNDWHEFFGELMYTFGSARVCTVTLHGSYSTSPEEKTVSILKLRGNVEVDGQEQPKHYVRVGSTYYPLIINETVVLKAEEGLFMLSYVHERPQGELQDVAVFSFPSPASGDAFLAIILDLVTEEVAAEEDEEREQEPGVGIKQGIVSGASMLAYGIVKTAEFAGSAVEHITPQVISSMGPSTSEPTAVSPMISRGFEITRHVSASAVNVSGIVANRIGNALSSFGTFLAPHIERQGVNFLQATGLSPEQASQTYSGAMNITSGAIEGVRTLYDAMDQSSKLVASSIADNTVKIVKHKYGPEVGNVADDGFNSAGNAYVAAQQLKIFTPRGAVKKTLKETGAGVASVKRREP